MGNIASPGLVKRMKEDITLFTHANKVYKDGEISGRLFELNKEAFMQVNEDGEKFLPKGEYKIYVGGAVPSERSEVLGAPRPIEIVLDWKTLNKL